MDEIHEEPSFHTYGVRKVSYYSEYIIHVIIEALYGASKTVKANMAYLSNEEILDVVKDLPNKGITVEIIISNTDNNKKKYSVYNELLSRDVKIYEFGQDDWKKGIMHRKSVVIDSKIVLSGSYNWTDHADRNTEELFVIEDLDTVDSVECEFEKLKAQCKSLVFQQPSLGRYSTCTKDKVVRIKKWWDSLDKVWQSEFITRFKLQSEPGIDELMSLINSESVLINFSEIASLEPLKQFTNLKQLTLYSCKNIKDLYPLSGLKNLEYLDIAVTSVDNLESISELEKLAELNISNTNVKNLDSLSNLKLKKLYMHNINLPFFGAQPDFFKNNPHCKINDYT